MLPSRSLLASLSLLLTHHGVHAATSSIASWQFPNTDGMIINYIDTVVLQWTGNYATPFMQMWCQAEAADVGNNVIQGSNFPVNSTGRYSYIISAEDPAQTSFPVACHAQLATAKNGGGIDSPVGVTFVSLNSVLAKTFSLAISSPTSSSPPSSSPTSSSSRSSSSSTGSTSSPTIAASLPTSSPTNTVSPTSTSNPALASPNSASLSSGAKTGIGIGIALVAILIIAAVFLATRRKRKNAQKKKEQDFSVAEMGEDGALRPELIGDGMRHEMEARHGAGELDDPSKQGMQEKARRRENEKRVYEMPG